MKEWICVETSSGLYETKELVRCKNCKHYDGDGTCMKIGIAMLTDDWFCADGEETE